MAHCRQHYKTVSKIWKACHLIRPDAKIVFRHRSGSSRIWWWWFGPLPAVLPLPLFTLGPAAQRWSCLTLVWISSFIPHSREGRRVWQQVEEDSVVEEVGLSHVVVCSRFGYEGVRVWMGQRQLLFLYGEHKNLDDYFPPFEWNLSLWKPFSLEERERCEG